MFDTDVPFEAYFSRSQRLMRFARNFLLLTLAAGAAACSSDDLGPTVAVIPPLAYVRYINALPDTLATTVRWIDDIEFTPQTFVGVDFRAMGQGGWQGLRAGNRAFRIFTYQQNVLNFPIAGNTTVLKDTTFNFVAGSYYTILYYGYTRTGQTPAAQLRIFADDPPASPATGTSLRVYNLAAGAGNWDLHMGPAATAPTDTTQAAVAPLYTAGQLGTLVASGTDANAGTAVLAYTNRAIGTFGGRLTQGGTLARFGAALSSGSNLRVAAPVGLAETADFEAAGGTNINGSVMTAWVFPRRVAGSPGATTAGLDTRPFVLFTVDRSPARTIAP